MRNRGVLLALIALGLLVAFVARELSRDQAEGKLRESDVVFSYGTYRVTSYSLELGGEQPLSASFSRGEQGWQVDQGPEQADPAYAADVLSAWSRIRFVEVVDEAPTDEDLSRFGLDEPLARIEAQIAAEGEEPARIARLVVGKPSPLRPAYYARIDDFSRVVFVSPDAGDLFQGAGRQVMGLESLRREEPRR